MTYDTIFNLTCGIAAIGWIIILVASPYWKNWDKFIIGIIILILALTYSCLNLSNFIPSDVKKFGSLDGIFDLYHNRGLLTAGWEHFLAFDLFVAVWIKRNSLMHGIKHWMIIVPIIFTCMLGPLGFILYILVRWFKTKQLFPQNF